MGKFILLHTSYLVPCVALTFVGGRGLPKHLQFKYAAIIQYKPAIYFLIYREDHKIITQGTCTIPNKGRVTVSSTVSL